VFIELYSKLGFTHEFSSPYYPQSNTQVEVVNKILKTILQRTVDKQNTNWNHMLFSTLWAYHIVVKTTTNFTPFDLVHGVEVVLPIECEIPTLCTAIDLFSDTTSMEQRFLNIKSLDKDWCSSLQNNKAAKKCSKGVFDHQVYLWSLKEGDLVLAHNITHDTLGHGKFESLWRGPFIVRHCLTKGAYILVHPEADTLKDPSNGLYLKKFYP
jgi:hypothetical protein